MRENSFRRLAAALCLLLTLAACGSSGKIPDSRKGLKPVEQAAQYDDSLIAEAVSLDTGFPNEYGDTCRVSVHLPQLLSDGAKALNQRILDIWGDLAEKTPEDFAGEKLAVTVGWESHWSGSLLSLVIMEERPDTSAAYWVFHYDFAQEQERSAGELLNRLNIPEDTLRSALCRAAASDFDKIFADGRASAPEELALCRAKTLAMASDAAQELQFYPNEDGSLTAYLDVCTPIGAGWSVWEVNVPLTRKAAPLRAEDRGVAATLRVDGTVEIVFEKGSVSESLLETHGFECGKSYPIDGCYGKYQKLFVGSVGADGDPCLFLLTDTNTVEFIRLLDGFRFGKLVNHGPLYGVGVPEGLHADPPKVVDFEAGAGARAATVFAVMDDGSRCDLAEAVNAGGTLCPYDLSGSWEAAVTQPDGVVTEYSMQIRPDGSLPELTLTETVPDAGVSVSYTGDLAYMGMDGTGMLYGCTVTGPDGNDVVGTLSLLPQGDTMTAVSVGGDRLFDVPNGLSFVRSDSGKAR